jgi:hypothetical protein
MVHCITVNLWSCIHSYAQNVIRVPARLPSRATSQPPGTCSAVLATTAAHDSEAGPCRALLAARWCNVLQSEDVNADAERKRHVCAQAKRESRRQNAERWAAEVAARREQVAAVRADNAALQQRVDSQPYTAEQAARMNAEKWALHSYLLLIWTL